MGGGACPRPAGAPRASLSASGRVIVSSGLPQLIAPVLEREGLELEVRCNGADPLAEGWRVRFRDEGPCPVCGDMCKRRSLPGGPAARLRRRRRVRPLRRACLRAGLRPQLARRRARARGDPVRAVRDPRRRCCCPFLTRTTSCSPPSDSGCSGPTSRTSGSTARFTARSAGARCGSQPRAAGSTSSRSTISRRPVVERLLGLPFDLDAFTTWAVVAAGARRDRPAARRVPTAAFARSVREPRHLDHGAAGFAHAAFAIRSRFVERFGTCVGARLCVSDEREGRGGNRGRALRTRLLEGKGRAYTVGLARSDVDLAALAALPDDEVRARLIAVRGIGAWTAEWFLARHLARPRAWPAGDLALRKAVDLFYGSDVYELGQRLDPFQNLSAHYLLTASRMP